METKKETKTKKAPAMKAAKTNPELEALKATLAEKETANIELRKDIKYLEEKLYNYQMAIESLSDELSYYKDASFFTKLNNLFRK